MTREELKKQREALTPDVYLFCGEEPYLGRNDIQEFRRAVLTDETLETFNHFVFRDPVIDYDKLLDAVGTPPMMAERKLVEWHHADFDALKEKDFEALTEAASLVRANGDTILIFFCEPDEFDPGTDRRPSRIKGRLDKILSCVVNRRSADAQLISWLRRHFAHDGVGASPDALRRLIDRVGHSMTLLAFEVEKLVCYAKFNELKEVTPETVDLVSCTGTDEEAFGLSNALLTGEGRAAFRQLDDMRRRRVPPPVILAQIEGVFADLLSVALLREEGLTTEQIAATLSMKEGRVRIYQKAAARRSVSSLRARLDLCREADALSKTSPSATDYGQAERLLALLAR